MSRSLDLALTASAPMIWGTSYLVTTNLLPDGIRSQRQCCGPCRPACS